MRQNRQLPDMPSRSKVPRPILLVLFRGISAMLVVASMLLLPAGPALSPSSAAMAGGPGRAAMAIARLDPRATRVRLGQEAVVTVRIDDVSELYEAEIHLTFDALIVEVVDVDPDVSGVQIEPLDALLSPDIVTKNKACNAVVPGDPDCQAAGVILYSARLEHPSPPASGSGGIAAIRFRASSPGRTEILITYASAADREGTEIPLTKRNGSLTVVGNPFQTSTPTATGTPTRTVSPSVTPTPSTTPSITPTPSITSAPSQTPTATPIPDRGRVEGVVFLDTNSSGVRDPGEKGLPGLSLRVSSDGAGPATIFVTGPDGVYGLGGLWLDVRYIIKQFPAPGYRLTTPGFATFAFPSGGSDRLAEISFGNVGQFPFGQYLPIILAGS